MKKLMIAAVAAASAGFSFAADCGCACEDVCSTDCVYAYEVILLAKTTSGKPVTVMPKTSPCGCEEVTPCSSSCYRKPLMRKFAGFVFGNAKDEAVEGCGGGGDGVCGSACGCIDFSANENQVFWDVKTKKIVEGAKLTFDKIDAIGYQSRETVEAYGSFEFVENEIDGKVTLAGFGKRGKRANGTIMLKNLSGFFAGYYPCLCTTCGTTAESPCADVCESTIALPWSLCCDEVVEDDDGHTAAYGKWTLKWNETARQRLTKNYSAAALTKNGYQTPSIEE